MISKAWTDGAIRALARKTIEGKEMLLAARGEYLKALVETAQAELGGRGGQEGQRAAVKLAHSRFYPVVLEVVTTSEIAKSDKVTKQEKRRRALERNRRSNFARSAYGTIRRWLRAEGHDLMKLDAQKVTKSQLINEAPPARKHALTARRVQQRAAKLIGGFLAFTRQVAKTDEIQANAVAVEALDQITKVIAKLGMEKKHTTDAQVAAKEMRPLRVGGNTFWPVETRIAK